MLKPNQNLRQKPHQRFIKLGQKTKQHSLRLMANDRSLSLFKLPFQFSYPISALAILVILVMFSSLSFAQQNELTNLNNLTNQPALNTNNAPSTTAMNVDATDILISPQPITFRP